jgi:pimeloyl-ACP methyl ester carboxylesterase
MAEFIVNGEARIACDASGSGPALVLMHGAEASRQMFAAIVPLLAKHFTVIAYDQRDCGETEGPQRAATLEELADDAQALVRAHGFERAHVFGSSFGGRVAQAYASRHADTLDRLVLGSTWPLPESLGALNPVGTGMIRDLRSRLPDSAEELAAVFFPEPFLVARPDLRRFFAQVRPQTQRSRRRADSVEATLDAPPASIAARTLLVAGELDRIVPPAITLGMSEQIKDCTQVLLEGVGHATALQAPAELASRIIDFLRGP